MTRRIERTNQFKRDYKKARKRYGANLDAKLVPVLDALFADKALPVRNRDHALTGNWVGTRECHIRPDLLLIYQKSDEALTLVRLGSHSDLFD